MEIQSELTVKVPDPLRKALGLNKRTKIDAKYENGCIVLELLSFRRKTKAPMPAKLCLDQAGWIQIGYDDGFNAGYDEGYEEGYEEGLTAGNRQGYTSGYWDGYIAASEGESYCGICPDDDEREYRGNRKKYRRRDW